MRRFFKLFIKYFTPPIFPYFVNRIGYYFAHSPINSRRLKLLENRIPRELVREIEHFLLSDDYDQTSKYWKYLIHRHLRLISVSGIENYGTSVALNYFTWKTIDQNQLEKLIKSITPTPPFTKFMTI